MGKQKASRLHHYAPRHYLKGFAKKPTKDAKLCVFDMHKMDWLPNPTSMKKLGAVNDFNRVDIEGIEIDALEKSLSGFETESGKVLNRIRESQRMPQGDDFVCLMNLVALMSIRNPQTRECFRSFQKNILKKITSLTLATKERYESSVRQAKEAGYGSDLPDIPYEEMLRFHEEERYEIKIANQAFYSGEFGALDTVIETLMGRKWMFFVADMNSGHFICGDHPVRLRWTKSELANGSFPPGHGMKSTEVIFPVSKDIAMVGSFEGRTGELRASRKLVSMINRAVIEGCQRHVYALRDDFEIMGPGDRIFCSREIPQLLQRVKDED